MLLELWSESGLDEYRSSPADTCEVRGSDEARDGCPRFREAVRLVSK
jgi:hypothetical protein